MTSTKNKVIKTDKDTKYYLDYQYPTGSGIIKNINDKYYIEYSDKDQKISLKYCEHIDGDIFIEEKSNIYFFQQRNMSYFYYRLLK